MAAPVSSTIIPLIFRAIAGQASPRRLMSPLPVHQDGYFLLQDRLGAAETEQTRAGRKAGHRGPARPFSEDQKTPTRASAAQCFSCMALFSKNS